MTGGSRTSVDLLLGCGGCSAFLARSVILTFRLFGKGRKTQKIRPGPPFALTVVCIVHGLGLRGELNHRCRGWYQIDLLASTTIIVFLILLLHFYWTRGRGGKKTAGATSTITLEGHRSRMYRRREVGPFVPPPQHRRHHRRFCVLQRIGCKGGGCGPTGLGVPKFLVHDGNFQTIPVQ